MTTGNALRFGYDAPRADARCRALLSAIGAEQIGVGVDAGAPAEIGGDAGRSPIPFGAALVLEPIDAQ
jgi:hypothetical protein